MRPSLFALLVLDNNHTHTVYHQSQNLTLLALNVSRTELIRVNFFAASAFGCIVSPVGGWASLMAAVMILIAEERAGGKFEIAANEQWHNVTLRIFSSATISLVYPQRGRPSYRNWRRVLQSPDGEALCKCRDKASTHDPTVWYS